MSDAGAGQVRRGPLPQLSRFSFPLPAPEVRYVDRGKVWAERVDPVIDGLVAEVLFAEAVERAESV